MLAGDERNAMNSPHTGALNVVNRDHERAARAVLVFRVLGSDVVRCLAPLLEDKKL